jgi:hypothetical protein
VLRYRRPADRRTRPQRWREAVAELLALQAEYTAWLQALPDSLQDTDMAERLQTIVELDLDALASALTQTDDSQECRSVRFCVDGTDRQCPSQA